MSGILHQIRVKLTGSDELSSVLKRASGSVERFKRAADQMKSVGVKMMGTGIGLGSALAGAVAPAMRLEESLANLSSVSTLPADGVFRDMKAGMESAKRVALSWSSSHVQSAKEVTDAMYDLASAGLTVSQVNEVVSQTMALASATRADAAESSAMMAKALKTFGETQLAALPIGARANAVMDAFASVVKNAKTTLPELGAALKSVMGTAANAGLTIQETSASVGLLMTRGLPAEQAGTALSAVLRQLPKAAKELGFTVADATGRLVPMTAIVSQLTARYAEGGVSVKEMAEIQEVFGDEAGRAIQLLIGQDSSLKDLTAAAGAAGTAMGMVALQEDSFSAQGRIAWNNAKNAATVLGDAMLPALRGVATSLGVAAKSLKAFAEGHPAVVKVVATLGLAATAILTLGGGALWLVGSFTGSIASVLSMAGAVSKAGGAMTVLRTGILAVGRALMGLFLNPVGLVIAAVAGLGLGLYLLYKKSETFRNIVHRVGATLKSIFMPVLVQVAYGAGFVAGTLGKAWQTVRAYTVSVWPMVSRVIGGFALVLRAYLLPSIALAKGVLVAAWGVIKTITVATWRFLGLYVQTAWAVVVNVVKIGWAVVSGVFKAALQVLTGDWTGAWETIKGTLASVWEGIRGIFDALKGYFTGLGSIFYDAGAGLIGALTDGLLASWNTLKSGVVEIGQKIREYLPFSDAKKGPLADLTASGRALGTTFAGGIRESASLPVAQAEGMAAGTLDAVVPELALAAARPTVQNTTTNHTRSIDRGAVSITIHCDSQDLASRLEDELTTLFSRLTRQWGDANA